MTGPNIFAPKTGSNAIGSFAIGESPIGDIPAFDWWQTIISQYANSPTLTSIVGSFFEAIDQTEDMQSFYDLVWDVWTAQGWGLDVWGRIVGVGRILHLSTGGVFFGFANGNANADYRGFNQAPFYSGSSLTTNFSLTDPAFRLLIAAKALSNICDGSIPAINRLLMTLFPNRGNCYVADDGGMSLTYTFEFSLTPPELAIVTNSGVLPTPTGVGFNVSSVNS